MIRARRQTPRGGFTLIEVLVVIGILGVLFALLLPAVQAARESARRIACSSNLRQLGIAMHGYESVWGRFPAAPMAYLLPGTPLTKCYFSWHTAVLAQLDQAPLHNAINFQVPTDYLSDFPMRRVNLTAAEQSVGVFLCPSDPHGRGRAIGPVSYRTNRGTCGICLPQTDDGAFIFGGTAPSDFRDGLSQTIALSERLIGSPRSGKYVPSRDWIETGVGNRRALPLEEWVNLCANQVPPLDVRFDSGGTWMLGGAEFTQFYVGTPPNSAIPDCGTEVDGGIGVFAARSMHPGGVNAMTADGSVRFATNGTEAAVWRALGTRAGGEGLSAQ